MFKVDQIEKTQAFGEIPDGVYPVTVAEAQHVSDEKSTRFEFTFVHSDGAYKNRKSWAKHMYIGIATTKKETLKIQQGQLADLFFIAGIKGFDSEEEAQRICGDIVGTELKIRIRNSEWQGKNFANVEDYWAVDGANRSGKKLPTNVTPKVPASKPVAVTKEKENEDVPF